jgi:hypothetical protein
MSDVEPALDVPTDVADDVKSGCFWSLVVFLGLISGIGLISIKFFLI